MWVGDLRLGAGIGAWGGRDQEAGEKGVVAVMCQIKKKKKKNPHQEMIHRIDPQSCKRIPVTSLWEEENRGYIPTTGMLFLTCLSRYTCTRAEKCPSDVGNKLWYQTCQIWGHRVPSCLPAKGPVVQSTLLSLLLLQSLLSEQLTYCTGLMVMSRENSKPEAFPCRDKKWVEKTEGRRI